MLPNIGRSVAALCLALGLSLPQQQAQAGPLIVTNDDFYVIGSGDSPFVSDGASIGSENNSTGRLFLESGTEWTNNGGFWGSGPYLGLRVGVGDRWTLNGSDATPGYITFESGSTFNNTGTVELGNNLDKGAFITLEEGAVWNNVGRTDHTDFYLRNGELNIFGTLDSNTPTQIGLRQQPSYPSSSVVNVSGEGALWNVPILGISSTGDARLSIMDGGTVTSFRAVIGDTLPSGIDPHERGEVWVGGGAATSTWEVHDLDIGLSEGSWGDLTVGENGRVDMLDGGRLWLGRGGGLGSIQVESGGEIFIQHSSAYPAAYGATTIQLYTEHSTIDLSAGGRILMAQNDVPLSDSPFHQLAEPGTLRMDTGTLKGIGTIIGDVVNYGGTVSPGNSPGTLSIMGDLILNGGILELELGDLLDVTGDLFFGNDLQVNVLGADPLGDIFDLGSFFRLGGDFSFGSAFDFRTQLAFVGLDDNPFDTVSLFGEQYSLAADPGPQPVPEPGVLYLVGLGLTVIGMLRLRRRNSVLRGCLRA